MIELAIWKTIVLIFIHVSTVIKPLILQIDASKTNRLQEERFTLDGSLLGNGLQQPRRYFAHTTGFFLEYWKILKLRSLLLFTLYLTGGKVMVIYKLQSHIKRAWATTCHTRFKVVARDRDAPEHAFGWRLALKHLCRVETSLFRLSFSLFKELGTLPLEEDLNFLPVLEEFQELH